jgi:dipeptidyl aminopeptidase/acylaminoacyl peptidase
MHFLVSQLKSVGKQPEVIVLEPKEGHGFRDLENNVDLFNQMLPFFDKYIGNKTATAQTSP